MGFIIMEPEDTPPMSGSNSICVSTVLLETGIIEMTEPITRMTLEAPGGIVEVEAFCQNGKAERITVQNLPSFVDKADAILEVTGLGTFRVDTAYGGDSFVIIDAGLLGLNLRVDEARDLADLGRRIADSANEQLGFHHPENPEWQHISFCQFAGPLTRNEHGVLTGRNAVAIKPGKIDRSPTGTGVSARMALLHEKGEMDVGDRYLARSIIDSTFEGLIDSKTTVGSRSGIIPKISGQAWLTGTHQLFLDRTDPWPGGYRLSDTWPTPSPGSEKSE